GAGRTRREGHHMAIRAVARDIAVDVILDPVGKCGRDFGIGHGRISRAAHPYLMMRPAGASPKTVAAWCTAGGYRASARTFSARIVKPRSPWLYLCRPSLDREGACYVRVVCEISRPTHQPRDGIASRRRARSGD